MLTSALRQLHGYGGPQPRKRPNTPEALAFDALLGLRIDAASRTDSGVHAARQVVSVSVTDADARDALFAKLLTADPDQPVHHTLLYKLNRMLAKDLRVLQHIDPRIGTQARLYRYEKRGDMW